MALTWTKLIHRILKTLFFIAVLWTLVQPKFYQFLFAVDDHNTDLMKWLKSVASTFVYLVLITGTAAMLVVEFVEETDEELINTGRYAVHGRKLSSGYLKDTATQTGSACVIPTWRTTNDQLPRYATSALPPPPLPTSFEPFRVWRDVTKRKTISSPGPFNVSSASLEGNGLVFPGWDKYLVRPEACTVTFNDLIGIENLKATLNQQVLTPFFSGASQSSNYVPRGVMIIGGQGSGKSSIAQAIVNRLRSMTPTTAIQFYKVDCSNCFGPFIDAGVTFHDLFHEAGKNTSKSVVLFENINNLYHRSVDSFLSEMTSIRHGNLLVIATARKRDQLHDQLQASGSGRFDYIFDIEFPDYKERLQTLKMLLNKRGLVMEEDHAAELAGYTYTYNCGELTNLVELISKNATEAYYRSANLNKKGRQCFDDDSSTYPNDAALSSSSQHDAVQVGRESLLSGFEAYKKQRVHPKLRFMGYDNYEEKKAAEDATTAVPIRNDSATVAENHGRLNNNNNKVNSNCTN